MIRHTRLLDKRVNSFGECAHTTTKSKGYLVRRNKQGGFALPCLLVILKKAASSPDDCGLCLYFKEGLSPILLLRSLCLFCFLHWLKKKIKPG